MLVWVLAGAALAGTWLAGDMTDAGEHPRLLVRADEVSLVHDRVTREPYASLVATTQSRCDRSYDLTDMEVGPVQVRANTARACAWLFYLDRTWSGGEVVPFTSEEERLETGQRAVEYLLSLPTEARTTGPLEGVLDIHTAQELHMGAEALDLLLGAELDALGDDRQAAIQGVADLAADFYADHMLDDSVPWTRSLLNNHRAKSAGALGLAAMALNGESFEATVDDGRYDPELWVDFALAHTDLSAVDIVVDGDGGYCEGPGYVEYGWLEVIPFALAWHRYTGGASWEVVWDPTAPPWLVTGANGPWTVTDPWEGAWLDAQLDWLLAIQLPDGTFPPLDDTSAGGDLWWGAFVQPDRFERAAHYAWAWEQAGRPAGGSVEMAPFLVLAYDDAVGVEAPPDTSVILPHSGQAVLRAGRGSSDTTAMLLAEHATASAWVHTRWGQTIDSLGGHEHPDALAVLLYAGTEALVLDSGYLGWSEHHKVNSPENHSLILVDGLGAQGYQAVVPEIDIEHDGSITFLDPSVEGGWAPGQDGQGWIVAQDLAEPSTLSVVHAVTRYDQEAPPTELSRTLVLLQGRYAVLLDQAASEDGLDHDYTHQLHLHCGGTSGGTLTESPHGAVCEREGASLLAVVLSPQGATQSLREAIHDAPFRQERTHLALDSVATGTEASFVSALLPAFPDQVLPEVEAGDCAGPCIAWEDADGIECEAWTGWDRALMLGERVLVRAHRGAWCESDGVIAGVFGELTGSPGSLVSARFHVDGEQLLGWRARIHAGRAVPLPAMEPSEPEGACAWSLDGEDWLIDAPLPAEVYTAPSSDEVVVGLAMEGVGPLEAAVVTTGERVVLDPSASCGIDSSTLDWSLARQPELSRAQVVDGVLVPDLPGIYTVRLEARGEVVEHTLHALGEPPPQPGDTGDTADTGVDEPGCGCQSWASGGWWALVALLLIPARRYRPRISRK